MRLLFFVSILLFVAIWKLGLPSLGGSFDHLPPGRAAPSDPIQTQLKHSLPPIAYEGYYIYPQAKYSLQALVLGKKNYAMSRDGKISPVDLALGWQGMSNPLPLKSLTITQSGRFYFYRWKGAPPISPRDIKTSSANTHIIPANDRVRDALKKVKKGSVVSMTGYLVNVKGDNGYHWNTSMTRHDTGDGACEIFYVQSLNIQ